MTVTLYMTYLGPRMGILGRQSCPLIRLQFTHSGIRNTTPSDKQHRSMNGPGASRPRIVLYPEHKEIVFLFLGTVIYEVLSREAPFAANRHACRVVSEIIAGSRPTSTRCQGMQGSLFTDALWEMSESCWRNEPGGRPRLRTIFRRLQDAR